MSTPSDDDVKDMQEIAQKETAALFADKPEKVMIGHSHLAFQFRNIGLMYFVMTQAILSMLMGNHMESLKKQKAFLEDIPSRTGRILTVGGQTGAAPICLRNAPSLHHTGAASNVWTPMEEAWSLHDMRWKLEHPDTSRDRELVMTASGHTYTRKQLDMKTRLEALEMATSNIGAALGGFIAIESGASPADVLSAAKVGGAAFNLVTAKGNLKTLPHQKTPSRRKRQRPATARVKRRDRPQAKVSGVVFDFTVKLDTKVYIQADTPNAEKLVEAVVRAK